MTQRNMPQVKPDKWVRPSGQGGTAALRHRVVSGGHPPAAYSRLPIASTTILAR